jgi:hypothetical protein
LSSKLRPDLNWGFFPQLKSLFEIFTFVSEKNIKYQYLFLASLILVACHRNRSLLFPGINISFPIKKKKNYIISENYFIRNLKWDVSFPGKYVTCIWIYIEDTSSFSQVSWTCCPLLTTGKWKKDFEQDILSPIYY